LRTSALDGDQVEKMELIPYPHTGGISITNRTNLHGLAADTAAVDGFESAAKQAAFAG
jgi:hypothetical protein